MAVVFKGFSTPSQGRTKTLYNEELIRQDLLNHFNTRKGVRAFDANYGFIGWDLIFSLDSYNTLNLIEADCRRIVYEEPRVELLNIAAEKIDYGYVVELQLKYVILNSVETLRMVFDNRNTDKMSSYVVS